MSDDVTPNDMPGAEAATETVEPTTDTTSTPEPLTAAEKEELAKLRAIHKDEKLWEKRAKQNFDDAQKWREVQEKSGDPMARIDELTTKFEAAERARIRSDVARTTGVDPEDIHGTTEDEMRESAERWNTRFNTRLDAAVKSKTVPAAAQAAEVTSDNKVTGPKSLTPAEYAALPPAERKKARDEGRLDSYMRGEVR